MVDSIGDSLDQALEGAFTRRIPQSAQAQMKFLVKAQRHQGRGTGARDLPAHRGAVRGGQVQAAPPGPP
ncbi:hypothetical protein QF037_009978 [Streptomyces canus]|nr:hypothetical protein [Streptomyces canus]